MTETKKEILRERKVGDLCNPVLTDFLKRKLKEDDEAMVFPDETISLMNLWEDSFPCDEYEKQEARLRSAQISFNQMVSQIL